MKIQDILFFILVFGLFYFRNPRWFTIAGIISLLFAIPLFANHIFFTAEHLTYYAAGFLFIAVGFYIVRSVKTDDT